MPQHITPLGQPWKQGRNFGRSNIRPKLEQNLGCRVHGRLERGLVYWLERRGASRGSFAPRYNLRSVLFTERRFFLLGEGRDDKADGQPNGK